MKINQKNHSEHDGRKKNNIKFIMKSVVQISYDDGETPMYENTRKVKFHHNRKSNL